MTPFGFRIVQTYTPANDENMSAVDRLQEQVEFQESELSRLRQAALRDPITEGANMRCLGISWDWLEEGDPVSLLSIDIDGFHRVNDCLGRQFGDHLLKAVQFGLEQGVRWDDIVAREGADRFIVLLPLAIAEDAQAVAERLRRSIERMCFEVPQGRFKMSIRVGCATRNGRESLETVIERADQACRQSKGLGGNAVFAA